jgi:hypothetical protein
MSLFGWFSKKAPVASARPASERAAAPGDSAIRRKTERVERREQLYSVVRDAMTRAGVLAASYKFKVLSLDARGANFLVMVDLSSQAADAPSRLAEIEALIAQNAKSRHEILVSAVYWRMNEMVTTGLSARKPVAPVLAPVAAPPVLTARRAAPHPGLDANEVMTFKNAFAASAAAAPLVASGQILTTGRRNPSPVAPFANTEVLEGEERASPLGTTQYGDLN